jgi:beta-phosphoglucomutase-like phosphatase (HAD superfamily)
VLVDSEPISNRVLSGMLSDFGLPMTAEQSIAAFLGRGWPTIAAHVLRELGRPLPDYFHDRYLDAMFTAFEAELAPVPGVVEALDAIDLPSCVASSGPPEKIRWTLGHTGLLERFTQPTSPAGTGDRRIFSATEVEHGKPAPDLFLHAAATMGWEPVDCAVVEDSRAGVQAALAAGMTAFGYAGRTPAVQLEGARVFTDMAELPALLQAPALGVVAGAE